MTRLDGEHLRQMRGDALEIATRYAEAMGSDRDIRRLALLINEVLRLMETGNED